MIRPQPLADELQREPNLPLLDAAQRHQVLHEWNATKAPYPSESCIHELFEAHVVQAPHAPALVHDALPI